MVERPDSSGSSSFQKGYGGIPWQSLNIQREDDLTELLQLNKDGTPKFNIQSKSSQQSPFRMLNYDYSRKM